MGDLILCNQALAARPYFIEEASLNLYSLEELCYYIENHLWMLEQDFINDTLCDWLADELGLLDASKKLRVMIENGSTLSDRVMFVLYQSGYCSVENRKHIFTGLQEMDHMTEFECAKMRADRFLVNKKYKSAAHAYRKLLSMDEKNLLLIGNVWHNLGMTYANMFFFEEASDCFHRAYEYNKNIASRNAELCVLQLAGDEMKFMNTAEGYGLQTEEIMSLDYHVAMAGKEEIELFSSQIFDTSGDDCREQLPKIVAEWMTAYRTQDNK